jgi:hypothetical protein
MDTSGKLNGFGTWRRYKLGQAQFTSWLKQTAEKLVTRKPEPEAAPDDKEGATPQQSRRQKKKAKGIAPGAIGGINFDAGSDKSVHWSQLEALAQRITDNAKPEDVPDAVINILRDVVGLRRKSFNFFSRAAKNTEDEKIKQSNASHAHIISVLERVLAKLEALVTAGGSRERGKESKDNARIKTSDLTNMFAYLEVQTAPNAAEDDESDEDVASAKQQSQKGGKKKGGKKAKKTKKPEKAPEKAVVKANGGASWVDKIDFGLTPEDEDEDDEFDLYMMVYCFFEDFNAIRNHVAERWCDYWYERSVSLNTLAVVTNAAFELFHQLEHDLVKELKPVHPELTKYDFMMNMLFIHFGIDHIDYDSYDDLTEEESDERIWRDESDWLGLTSCFTLQRVLELTPPGKVPMISPSQRTPTLYGANNMKDWKDFEGSVANQIITEGAHLKALKTNEQEPPVLPAESQLLLDFQDCLRRYDYNSALVFSLHLWVDVRHIMETEVIRPFEQLQTSAARIKQALETHNPSKFCRDHAFKRRWIARIWETKHYMLEDFTFEDKQARFQQIGMREDPEPFFLLKNEPVWAGLLDFRARLVYSQLGHEFVMLSSIVDAAAYLYHAAVAMDPSLPRWEGMIKYVETYVHDSRFRLGLQDESPAAIIRNFEGLPSVQREGEKTVAQIDGDKAFTAAISIRQSLFNRYAFDERRLPTYIFPEYLAELAAHRLTIQHNAQEQSQNGGAIMNSVHESHAGNENGDTKALVKLSNGVTKSTKETEEEFRRKRAFTQVSPLEMLQLLDDAVTSQMEGLLTLDYFKLFDESVALLETVSAAFGPELQDRLGPRDGEAPASLGRLPILIAQHLDQFPGLPQETEMLARVVDACGETLRVKEGSLQLA